MPFPDDWQRRCAIVIDDAQVGSGGVSNFTAYLTREAFPDEACSPTDGNRAQVNGGDLRFSSDEAGTTRLACCIDAWELDTTDGAGDAEVRVHVLVPSIAGAGDGDTTIYLWYRTASGTETQPAVDAAYGARAAWDDQHCHRYSLDEAPGGSAPQYADSVSPRAMTVRGTGVTQVTGQDGSAFDGNATGWADTGFGGFVTPNNAAAVPFTNTGICYVSAFDGFAVVNFDDEELVEVSKAGAELARFALTDGPTQPQGVAWNSATSQYAVVGASGSVLYLYQRDGTFDGTVTYSGSGNAVAYDPVADVYWVAQGSNLNLRSIDPSTGGTVTSVTVTGSAAGQAVDGLCYAPGRDTIFWVADAGVVYELNKSSGATLQSFVGPWDIEHAAYDPTDDSLWVCGDARYHSGSGGQLGENAVYKLAPDGGQPWGWRVPTTEYSVEWWWKPDAVATGDLISWWSAVKANALYASIQVRSLGAMRVYESDLTYVACPNGSAVIGAWNHWRVTYDAGAATLTVYKDNAQIAQNTSAVFAPRPDGRFGVGARFGGTVSHNGAIDELRLHRSSRSAAWWTTRYNNASAPASFAAPGTPEAPAPADTTLGADVVAASTIAGDLTTAIPLAAAAQANVTLGAALATELSLSATLTSTAACTSGLQTSITAAASLSASATLTPALTTAVTLASALATTSAVAGALETALSLACALGASSTLGADLATDSTLASALGTTSTLTAALATDLSLAASATSTASLVADLDTAVTLAAGWSTAATLTADLTAGAGLAGGLTSMATLSAALATQITGAAACSAASALSASLTTAIWCAAQLEAEATLAGDLATVSLSQPVNIAAVLAAGRAARAPSRTSAQVPRGE